MHQKPEWNMLFVLFRHLHGLIFPKIPYENVAMTRCTFKIQKRNDWNGREFQGCKQCKMSNLIWEHLKKKEKTFSWSARACMNNGSCWGSMWKMTLIHHIEWLIALVNRTCSKDGVSCRMGRLDLSKGCSDWYPDWAYEIRNRSMCVCMCGVGWRGLWHTQL